MDLEWKRLFNKENTDTEDEHIGPSGVVLPFAVRASPVLQTPAARSPTAVPRVGGTEQTMGEAGEGVHPQGEERSRIFK